MAWDSAAGLLQCARADLGWQWTAGGALMGAGVLWLMYRMQLRDLRKPKREQTADTVLGGRFCLRL